MISTSGQLATGWSASLNSYGISPIQKPLRPHTIFQFTVGSCQDLILRVIANGLLPMGQVIRDPTDALGTHQARLNGMKFHLGASRFAQHFR